ncbi:MAG TPA: SRPBCC family protein [Hyphomicrobiaceae bacterium]|nr:SRPBCC family protein [Hyphomicrobiaceae bacterium]
MRLENTFEVARPPAQAWDILMDVPRIAGCVPGADLIGREEDGSYKGSMAVTLGPVTLKFFGNVRITDADPSSRTASIIARGSDQKGRGNAGATTRVSIVPSGEGSLVRLETELQLSGMVAQYGRATGMVEALSSEIVAQFAKALHAELASADPAHAPAKPTAASEARATKAPVFGLAMLWRALLAWLRGATGRAARVE